MRGLSGAGRARGAPRTARLAIAAVRASRVALAAAALLAAPGCAPPPGLDADGAATAAPEAAAEARVPARPRDAGDFDPVRAREHASALAEHPRDASRYLREQLELAGFTVRAVAAAGAPEPDAASASLVAWRAGERDDALLLAAPVVDRRGTPSAAALALEAARALAAARKPYGTLVALVGPTPAARDATGATSAPAARDEALAAQLASVGALGRAMHRAGELVGVRAGFWIDGVCGDPPHIARDLASHGAHRELLLRTARALGRASAFESESFSTPRAGHAELAALGVHGLVALVDDAESAGRGCSLAGIDAVGPPLVATARALEERLARIERYASSAAATTASDPVERRAASLPTPAARDATGGESAPAAGTAARDGGS